jgi:transposase
MPTVPPLAITDAERVERQRRVRAHTSPQRAAKRARVALLAADGLPNRQIAPMVGMHEHTVAHWRHRFQTERLAGLTDRQRPGRPLVYGHDQRLRIVATVTQQPPIRPVTGAIPSWPGNWRTWGSRPPRSAGFLLTWTASRTGCGAGSPAPRTPASGSGRPTSVGSIWCRRPMRWCCRGMRRPGSVPAAAPGRPSRWPQAAQPARSRSTCGHGTAILLAALDVHGGQIFTATDPDRNTAANFIAFLDDLDAKVPAGLEVHLVLDNGSSDIAHDTRWWFLDHPRFHPHDTPSHASWLNQVELFFSILARRLLKRGEFHSVEDLVAKVMGFITDDNRTATPFRWTYDGRPLKAS